MAVFVFFFLLKKTFIYTNSDRNPGSTCLILLSITLTNDTSHHRHIVKKMESRLIDGASND